MKLFISIFGKTETERRMKKLLCLALFLSLMLPSEGWSQVSFSRFKFKKDSPFGCCPGRKMTDTRFEVTGDRAVKYIRVHYWGVNQVGDAVSSDIVGAVNANAEHTKNRILNLTGPFEPGERYSRWASATFIYPMKVTAFPYHVEILYMDGDKESVPITRDNLDEYFPCIKEWIEVNVEDGY